MFTAGREYPQKKNHPLPLSVKLLCEHEPLNVDDRMAPMAFDLEPPPFLEIRKLLSFFQIL